MKISTTNKMILAIAFLFCWAMAGCTKQTAIENKEIGIAPKDSEEYYANLRAYKKTDHQVYFGWFDGVGGTGTPGKIGTLDHIPDSVDIVSCWGGAPVPGSYNDSIMRATQKIKGTRFVRVSFDDGKMLDAAVDTNFVQVYDKGDSMLMVGFDLVAKNIKENVDKGGLDGIDFDHEPNYCGCDWGLLKNDRKYNMFLVAMSKYFGPLSGTDKMLIVDGEYGMITEETAKGLSYIVTQAYGTTSPSSLQNRLNGAPGDFPPHKFIVTENFEKYWKEGGPNYKDPIMGTVPSLIGMAYWQPTQGRKGGVGSFHTEYEYALNPDYKFTRQAIQIMNPAAK